MSCKSPLPPSIAKTEPRVPGSGPGPSRKRPPLPNPKTWSAWLLASALCAHAATFGRVVPLVGGASDLALDKPRARVYLTASSTNLLQIYSTSKLAFQTPLLLDQTPLAAAISRNGKFLYVACYNASLIDVVDLDALAIVTRVSLPARPEGVAVAADGRVLISTTGTTSGASILLLYDPAAPLLTALSTVPATPAALTSPPPSGRAFLAKHSQLAASRDGAFIAGVNAPLAGAATVFVYESASGTVLRARAVAGTTTALSISDDGSRIAAGSILYDAATLRVMGQQNVVNFPYPIVSTTAFATAANQGGAVFAPDGQTVYFGLNVAPVQGPTSASQLLISDPDNLLVRMGLQIPENLAGRMVISADAANLYALSDSGFVAIPLSTMSRSPLAVPATDAALLTYDPCGVNSATATASIAINNAGAGRITPSAQLLQFAGQTGQASPLTAPSVRTSSGALTFSLNNAATRGLGTFTPPHDFIVTAPEAINIPDRIRVYQNSRDSESRGTILPLAGNISPSAAFADLEYDSVRQRVYIANAGLNRVEVYDVAQQKFLAPVKVGQLPVSMALTPDASTLYVANAATETISIVDLDKLQSVGIVSFPPLPFASAAAPVTPVVIAAGLSGPQVMMSNNTVWKVVGTTAVPRPASSILGTLAAAATTMASTPGAEYILMVSNGAAYLYDATLDDFVAGRQIFTPASTTGYQGPVAAGGLGQFFVVNGIFLNQSLVPQASVPGLISAVAPVGATRVALFSPPAPAAANNLPAAAPTIQIIDLTTGAAAGQAAALEGPLNQVAAAGRGQFAGRTMAVDSTNTAYVITATGLSVIPLTPVPASARPQVTPRGAVSLATRQLPVSSNGLLAILGQNLALDDAALSTPLPATLGGVCVTLNNVALPLFMTSPTEIHAQIPPAIAAGNFPLIVRSLANHAASASQTLAVSKYAPSALNDSSGQLLLFHADGNYVNADNPANRDEPLTMYAVGLGPTTGGQVTAANPSPTSPLAVVSGVQVFFGDPTWVQAGIIVDWAGLTPGLIGVYQLNLRVPGFHIKGDDLPVTIRIGNVNSPNNAHVWVN